jgi:hypothetical protein
LRGARRYEGLKKAWRLAKILGAKGHEVDARWLLHNRVPCSCHVCGNPRRKLGEKTVQERKADEAFEAEKWT